MQERDKQLLEKLLEEPMSVLGRAVKPILEKPQAIELDKWVETIEMTSDEVTALCPVTGQRDFYTVKISFAPAVDRPQTIESKSLKLYLASFANVGVFAENLAVRICDAIFEVLQPTYISVETVQKSRGGISIRTIARRYPHDHDAEGAIEDF